MAAPLLLVTGTPGIGKTTLIRKVVERLRPLPMSGFYTEETRDGAERTGFRVVTLDGQKGPLATVGKGGGPHVGRYRVDLEGFEETALPSLRIRPDVELYVIDEIGKMESYSDRFVEAARELLESGVPVLASVALHGAGFIEEVKSHPRAELIQVTQNNRDELRERIASKFTDSDERSS
jgi:nucleoside-triphosphatase